MSTRSLLAREVSLRFSAFSYRTTPELKGRVVSISADLTTDTHSGQSYYTLRVAVPENEWQRLGALAPVAGMPVEAFIETGERTALGYLAKPFTDQLARAISGGIVAAMGGARPLRPIKTRRS